MPKVVSFQDRRQKLTCTLSPATIALIKEQCPSRGDVSRAVEQSLTLYFSQQNKGA